MPNEVPETQQRRPRKSLKDTATPRAAKKRSPNLIKETKKLLKRDKMDRIDDLRNQIMLKEVTDRMTSSEAKK